MTPSPSAGPVTAAEPVGGAGSTAGRDVEGLAVTQSFILAPGRIDPMEPFGVHSVLTEPMHRLRERPLRISSSVTPRLLEGGSRASEFGLELLDSSRQVLASVPLGQLVQLVPPTPFLGGSIVDPPDYASARFVRGSEMLVEVPVPSRPLGVRVLEPSPGTVIDAGAAFVDVVWELSDDAVIDPPDYPGEFRLSPVHEYTLFASLDGGDTYPLYPIVSHHSPEVVDADGLIYRARVPLYPLPFAHSSQQARVRVIAQVGLRWAAAESAEFAVEVPTEVSLPTITVSGPRNGETFEHGAVIELNARVSGFGTLPEGFEALAGRQRLDGAGHGTSNGSDAISSPRRVNVRWSQDRFGRAVKFDADPAKMATTTGSAYDGVYTWLVDTALLERGHLSLIAVAADGALSASDRVNVVVVAPGGGPTAASDQARWKPSNWEIETEQKRAGPDAGAPVVIRALNNDIAGEHPLDTATLSIVTQPKLGEAAVVMPPQSLGYPPATPLHAEIEAEIEAAQQASAAAEAAREGRTYEPPPKRTLHQEWDDKLRYYDRNRRGVEDLYRHHTIIVYTAPNYDGQEAVNDSFTYEICDTQPQPSCSQARVTVELNPPQDHHY